MKTVLSELKTAVLLTVILVVLLCGVYPLVVWAGAQVLFRDKANGTLMTDADGTVRGSTRLGQNFTDGRYFHSRPSAAGASYDATASSGTNLGPTSAKLAATVRERVAAYRRINGLPESAPVPADAVTSSASGLDPHISVANAELQAPRVARARGLALARVQELLVENTDGRHLGVFGEPGVNVLQLNLALDGIP